ncbi:tetrameric acyl-CoA thioesterase [Roseivirga seohaensis subsp. aquiponti]|uniref:Tetrameric acyl-CoA thioesterase n=2 Tax=Roseivirga seohaensis TaxID=1914963 RepID=A0A0L8AQD2_9BACT|nr:tetrameric acyl-CoA thioesterase [Roseivirga seohaensis subsp. aquiponti]
MPLLSRKQKVKMINWYPPFLGAGIKLTYLSDDFMKAEVQMKLRWWNKNLVGVHFGGSLASMCDPFYMLLLMNTLGRDYIVWDKAASIRFKRPGKGTVKCVFELTEPLLTQIKEEVTAAGKKDYYFDLTVTDEEENVVCEVHKTIYVRKKEG